MLKRFHSITILFLTLVSLSCQPEKKKTNNNLKTEASTKTDAIKTYHELANPEKRTTLTVSEYNTDNPDIENLKRPSKTIIRNLEIDTTKVFGIWTRDANGQHAEFRLNSKSFFVVDYDGDGNIPYLLDKNEITIFYNDFIQKGIITSTENNSLKIKWSDADTETKYVKFEN